MKVTLRTGETLDQFIAENEQGQQIMLGNNGAAVGPMQSVLMAAAGCSTIDVIMILQKMKQDVREVFVEVDSKRREEIPRIFTDVHLHFIIKGKVKEKKAAQAVSSSLEKYCSVSKIIECTAKVTSSFIIED